MGRRVPVDCLIELCKISNLNIYDIEKNIISLHSGHDRNGWNINFPILVDSNLASISEMIRTEGNINISKSYYQGITLANTEVTLLKKLEKTLVSLGINPKSFSLIAYIFIKPPENDSVTNVINEKNKKLKFVYTYSTPQKEKVVRFIDSLNSLNDRRKFMILLKSGKQYKITLALPKKGRIIVESDPNTKCRGYIQFSVYNSVLAKFLHYCFEIQNKKKSYNITLPKILKSSPDQTLREIISLVVSCEGHVGFYKKKKDRLIRIRLASKKYLEDIQEILSKFNIDSKIESTPDNLFQLLIRRKSNLIKFYKNFYLYHLKKQTTLKEMIKSYSNKKFTHFETDFIYLLNIDKMQPVTTKKLSKKLLRHPDGVCFRLNKLLKEGLIKRNGREFNGFGSTPYQYFLTKKGEEKIKNNKEFVLDI